MLQFLSVSGASGVQLAGLPKGESGQISEVWGRWRDDCQTPHQAFLGTR